MEPKKPLKPSCRVAVDKLKLCVEALRGKASKKDYEKRRKLADQLEYHAGKAIWTAERKAKLR